MELILMLVIAVFVLSYRQQNGESVYAFITGTIKTIYNKYAPYSYQEVKEKSKELGQEYTAKQYLSQVILFGGGAAGISYMYFYSIVRAILYGGVAILFIPYLAYLKNKKTYSEFIFEEVQVYCTNVINEFNTTQSFVKALEGVRDSGILEEPIASDVKKVIDMAYANGTIDEAVEWFNGKYPYYMVKNMHQLFLQITKEGAKDSSESLENMMLDIDLLVEGVYRDKMDRDVSHKKFIGFGIALYFLVMLTQALVNTDNYKTMLNQLYVRALLHGIIWVNTYFLISGEKFYNEDTGVE
ncbi:MAG TPA: hypothetical protein PLB45_01975 [Bacilli bacterium]|jgi:hypothetical protein|nr:hypothetical protein [Bacilli bacterium]HQC83628.1 hypothetical protein [Bacilli bacterium]